MGYLTLTCHFINSEWEIETAVLETWNVPELHTIINIGRQLQSVSEKWGVDKKVHCVVTDSGSNINGAVNVNHWNHLSCFARQLNLIVSRAIEEAVEVKEVID